MGEMDTGSHATNHADNKSPRRACDGSRFAKICRKGQDVDKVEIAGLGCFGTGSFDSAYYRRIPVSSSTRSVV
jgi:hypothetical protein